MSNRELEELVDDLPKGTGLDGNWFSEDRSPEDKDRTEKMLRNSTIQFRLLKLIVSKMFREKNSKEKDLHSPNWEIVVAYNEGYKTALRELYRLLP